MKENVLLSFISGADRKGPKDSDETEMGPFYKCVKYLINNDQNIKIYLFYNKDTLNIFKTSDECFKSIIIENIKTINKDFNDKDIIFSCDENCDYDSNHFCKDFVKKVFMQIKQNENIYFNCMSGSPDMKLPFYYIATYNKNVTMLVNDNSNIDINEKSRELGINYEQIIYEYKHKYEEIKELERGSFFKKIIYRFKYNNINKNFKQDVRNYIVSINPDNFNDDNNKKLFVKNKSGFKNIVTNEKKRTSEFNLYEVKDDEFQNKISRYLDTGSYDEAKQFISEYNSTHNKTISSKTLDTFYECLFQFKTLDDKRLNSYIKFLVYYNTKRYYDAIMELENAINYEWFDNEKNVDKKPINADKKPILDLTDEINKPNKTNKTNKPIDSKNDQFRNKFTTLCNKQKLFNSSSKNNNILFDNVDYLLEHVYGDEKSYHRFVIEYSLLINSNPEKKEEIIKEYSHYKEEMEIEPDLIKRMKDKYFKDCNKDQYYKSAIKIISGGILQLTNFKKYRNDIVHDSKIIKARDGKIDQIDYVINNYFAFPKKLPSGFLKLEDYHEKIKRDINDIYEFNNDRKKVKFNVLVSIFGENDPYKNFDGSTLCAFRENYNDVSDVYYIVTKNYVDFIKNNKEEIIKSFTIIKNDVNVHFISYSKLVNSNDYNEFLKDIDKEYTPNFTELSINNMYKAIKKLADEILKNENNKIGFVTSSGMPELRVPFHVYSDLNNRTTCLKVEPSNSNGNIEKIIQTEFNVKPKPKENNNKSAKNSKLNDSIQEQSTYDPIIVDELLKNAKLRAEKANYNNLFSIIYKNELIEYMYPHLYQSSKNVSEWSQLIKVPNGNASSENYMINQIAFLNILNQKNKIYDYFRICMNSFQYVIRILVEELANKTKKTKLIIEDRRNNFSLNYNANEFDKKNQNQIDSYSFRIKGFKVNSSNRTDFSLTKSCSNLPATAYLTDKYLFNNEGNRINFDEWICLYRAWTIRSYLEHQENNPKEKTIENWLDLNNNETISEVLDSNPNAKNIVNGAQALIEKIIKEIGSNNGDKIEEYITSYKTEIDSINKELDIKTE